MQSSVSTTPIELCVRRDVRLDFRGVPAVHTRGNKLISHFVNATSIAAPITEGILMRAGRRFAPRIVDAKMRRDLDAFMGQEGVHTREHQRFNKHLATLGYGVEDTFEQLDRMVRAREATLSERDLMAAVVCGEHAVYSLSKVTLDRPAVFDGMHPEVRRLLEWHSLEEVEHQSVCHDLYVHVFGDHPGRRNTYRKVYALSGTVLTRVYGRLMHALLSVDTPPSRQEWLAFVRWASVDPGFGPAVARELVAFLWPSFAHWGRAEVDRALIERALASVYDPAR